MKIQPLKVCLNATDFAFHEKSQSHMNFYKLLESKPFLSMHVPEASSYELAHGVVFWDEGMLFHEINQDIEREIFLGNNIWIIAVECNEDRIYFVFVQKLFNLIFFQ